jgi:DNA replication protein DnaC
MNCCQDNKVDLFVELESYRNISESGNIDRIVQADNLYKKTKDIEQVDKLCKAFLLADKAEKLFEQSKINKRFKNATFENFKISNPIQKEAFTKAQSYVDNIEQYLEDGTNLIFAGHGHVGTGKTHLANAIARDLMILKGIPCKFINVVSLIAELKESFSIKEFVDIEILIIDDLGKETGTKWVCEQMYAMLNSRYEQMKPTIITTENDIVTLKNNYDEKGKAIISRFCQDFMLIKLTGDDYRLKA